MILLNIMFGVHVYVCVDKLDNNIWKLTLNFMRTARRWLLPAARPPQPRLLSTAGGGGGGASFDSQGDKILGI